VTEALKQYEYFRTDRGVIYCADCLEILPFLEPVDLVLTDPPYGLGFPYLEYLDTQENLEKLIFEGFPILQEKTDRLYFLCGPTQIHLYPPADWVCSVTWNTTGTFGKYGYNQWTPVLCYGRDLKGFGNINGITKNDTFFINGGAGVGFMRSGEEKKHTCPKPINLVSLMVTRFSLVEETVLDPFLGSGTTAVACEQLNRRWVGIEISEAYCQIAKRRIEKETQQLKLFTV
jgi:DNA modification methylase